MNHKMLSEQADRRAFRAEGRMADERITSGPFDPELAVVIDAGYCLDAPEEVPTGSTAMGWIQLQGRQGAAVRWHRR